MAKIHIPPELKSKVVAFLELRRSGRGYEQKLRIDHGEGITTDDWFLVSVDSPNEEMLERSRPVGRPPGPNVSSIDWPTVDWDKSSRELALDYPQVSYSTIVKMRAIHGRGKLGNAEYRHIQWRTLDWNKNNQQLSAELGIEPGVIQKFRRRIFGKRGKAIGRAQRRVTDEMLAGIDWANTQDITLSLRWGVSRERVRQIRQVNQFPKCQLGHLQDTDSADFVKWLIDHREEISGKLATVVMDMAPKLPADRQRRIWLMRNRVDIPFVFQRRNNSKGHLANLLPIDWELPNWLLGQIWNKKEYSMAGNRSRYDKISPRFGGPNIPKSSIFQSPAVQAKIRQQISAALAIGIRPPLEYFTELGLWSMPLATSEPISIHPLDEGNVTNQNQTNKERSEEIV